jgi:hypothetical protein
VHSDGLTSATIAEPIEAADSGLLIQPVIQQYKTTCRPRAYCLYVETITYSPIIKCDVEVLYIV